MRGDAFYPHARTQAAFVSREGRIRCRLANHREINRRRGVAYVEFRPFAGDLFIGGEHAHQGAGPALTVGGQQTQGFNHRHQRAFGIAPVQAAIAFAEGEGIARPAAARRNGVNMGVEGEARSRSIVQDGDNVGPPRRVFAKGEIEPGGQQPAFQTFGGFTLMARWIFRIDGNQRR